MGAAASMLAGTVLALAGDREQPTVTRGAMAQSSQVEGAPNRTLGLSRVVVPPGASIPLL